MISRTSIPVSGTGVGTQLYPTERNGCTRISMTMKPRPYKGIDIVNRDCLPDEQELKTKNAMTAHVRILNFIKLHV